MPIHQRNCGVTSNLNVQIKARPVDGPQYSTKDRPSSWKEEIEIQQDPSATHHLPSYPSDDLVLGENYHTAVSTLCVLAISLPLLAKPVVTWLWNEWRVRKGK